MRHNFLGVAGGNPPETDTEEELHDDNQSGFPLKDLANYAGLEDIRHLFSTKLRPAETRSKPETPLDSIETTAVTRRGREIRRPGHLKDYNLA